MAGAGRNPPPYATPTKSRKQSRTSAAVVDGEDRISALPDAMILHVFSFLEIKDVVKTSALSRRWYSLWTQTSAVTINAESVRDFSYIERFFLQCTSPVIRKLHLLCLLYCAGYNFHLWIRFAVGRGIEHLCMDLHKEYWNDYYNLPRALFRCKSLKWLKLRLCEFPSLRNGEFMGISWSSLKVLCVHDMKMVDGVIKGVLEGSPLLESLTLETCYGMTNIRIFSKNMKELVIRRYCDPYYIDEYNEDDENRENSRLEIYAPYLRSLPLGGKGSHCPEGSTFPG
ncbi:hypothetical protein MLD38_019367 [Melastoma candidum]|uniref:Uncharacterized protein n=1 Tax=Melastoma candidum TaxID=119954 RepID=A0ACB9QWQ8_9MYRT|nr:hypothetical protein MLD38_019367 [Melastoma candidum]